MFNKTLQRFSRVVMDPRSCPRRSYALIQDIKYNPKEGEEVFACQVSIASTKLLAWREDGGKRVTGSFQVPSVRV